MARILLPIGSPCGSALSGSIGQPDGTWRNYVDIPDEALAEAGWYLDPYASLEDWGDALARGEKSP